MVDASNIQNVVSGITYDRVLGWLAPVKVIFIIIGIIFGLIIIWLAIFTDYLYLKYFIRFDEYYQWKAKEKQKKLIKAKEKVFSVFENIPSPEEVLAPREESNGSDWLKIFNRLNTDREINYKLAIIEADKIVNRKLDDMGVLGRNLRDKMENIPSDIMGKLGKLEKARKVLDELLKDDSLTIKRETAREVIDIYQKAYSDLAK